MRRVVLWGLVPAIAVVAILAAIVRWSSSAERAPAPRADGTAAVAQRAAARPRSAVLPAQRGLAPQRIAGRVVHAGQPVPRAEVRLVGEELQAADWTLARVVADAAGRFDLGLRPAARHWLIADAPGYASGGVEVDLRVPGGGDPPSEALVVELLDCAVVISGIVRDAAGGTIAAARVRGGPIARPWSTAVVDDSGRYRLCLTGGRAFLDATASGYGRVSRMLDARRDTTLDFPLTPEGVIAGRVVDADGSAVSGAVVLAARDAHDVRVLAETAADGVFRLEGLSSGRHRVSAREGSRLAQTVVDLPAGDTAELTLRLEEGVTVAGRVVVGDRPGRGARVSAIDGGVSWMVGSAVAQDDGRFVIEALPHRRVTLRVDGHRVVEPAGGVLDLTVRSGDLVLRCARLPSVAGVVRRGGKPIAGVDVYLDRNPPRVRTRGDGSFVLEGVSPGPHRVVAESARDAARAPARSLEVGEHDVTGLVLEIDGGAAAEGQVVDPAGRPLAGVTVHLTADDDWSLAVSAGDGTFRVTGLAGERTYRLSLATPDLYEPLRPAPGTTFPEVRIAGPDDVVTGLRITIAHGDHIIEGRAVRASGAPVATLMLVAQQEGGELVARARVSSDGEFQFRNLMPGRYALYVDAHGRGERPLIVEAGAAGVVLPVGELGGIVGTLRGFSTAPNVTAWRLGGGDRRAISPTAGGFVFNDVSPGTYDVIADSGADGRAAQRVTVTLGAVTRVTLEAGTVARLIGSVSDARSGAPLAGATCEARVGSVTTEAVTDEAGGFAIDVLPGRLQLACSGPGSATASLRDHVVEVPPGETTHVDVPLLVARHPVRSGPRILLHPDGGRFVVLGNDAPDLRDGDRVLEVDGRATEGLPFMAVRLLLTDHPAGATARVRVARGDRELVVEVR